MKDRMSLLHQLLVRLHNFPHKVLDDYSAAMEGVSLEVKYVHACVMQNWLKLGRLAYGWFSDLDTNFHMEEPTADP